MKKILFIAILGLLQPLLATQTDSETDSVWGECSDLVLSPSTRRVLSLDYPGNFSPGKRGRLSRNHSQPEAQISPQRQRRRPNAVAYESGQPVVEEEIDLLDGGAVRYPCDVEGCGVSLKTKGGLAIHKRIVHDRMDQCICSICGDKFNRQNSLLRHKSSRHGSAVFPCDVPGCAKVYKRFEYLKEHKFKKHNKGTGLVYECKECDKSYFDRSSLWRHNHLEHDNLRYYCWASDCEITFSKKSDRTRHIKRFHPGITLADDKDE